MSTGRGGGNKMGSAELLEQKLMVSSEKWFVSIPTFVEVLGCHTNSILH